MEYLKKMGAIRYIFWVLVLWMSLHGSVDSQVPAVNEPFPGDHGPEPTPSPPGGCPAICAQRLESAMDLIQELQRKVQALNITVSTRLNVLGSGTGQLGAVQLELPSRVSNLETYLWGNVTAVTNKLNRDLDATTTTLRQGMSGVRVYVDDRLAKLPTGGGDGSAAAMEVYTNLTGKLDLLEMTKIQTLIR